MKMFFEPTSNGCHIAYTIQQKVFLLDWRHFVLESADFDHKFSYADGAYTNNPIK